MEKEQEILEWEGDVIKDTITYRYIETAVSSIELAIEENPNLLETYKNWIGALEVSGSKNEVVADMASRSAVFSDFTPEENTKITIFSLPRLNEFLASFTTPVFNVSISFSYDFEKRDMVAARLVHFKGDYGSAIGWAESLLTRIDEAFAKIENN